MTNQQMELGFGGVNVQLNAPQHSRRAARAAWWFAQMRRIVESALDWQAAPEPRPEQAWFQNAQREIKI
jgi:hypothetical protein